MTTNLNIYGKDCVGCLREGKDIMVSISGKNQDDRFVFLDAFLTTEEALELIKDIQKKLKENEKYDTRS